MRTTSDNALHSLIQQADEADIRLTPGMAEGLARGNPRMIAYVADLIAVRGKRPAIEPRYAGGPLEPGRTYTVNEDRPEAVRTQDGGVQSINRGQPAVVTAREPGTVLPNGAGNGPFQPWAHDKVAFNGTQGGNPLVKSMEHRMPTGAVQSNSPGVHTLEYRVPANGGPSGSPYTLLSSPAKPVMGEPVAARLMHPLDAAAQGSAGGGGARTPATASRRPSAPQASFLDTVQNVAGKAIDKVEDGAVGLGKMAWGVGENIVKTAGTLGTVGLQIVNPKAWDEGQPMIRAAGDSVLTGLTKLGAGASHFAGRFTERGRNLQSHLDGLRATLDKTAPGDPAFNLHPWLKEQDKILQYHLPNWYASVRFAFNREATNDDCEMAENRGLTSPENLNLIKEYHKSRDPKIWAQIERNITTTPEELAGQQMEQDVLHSEGAKKFDEIWGKGASDNLVSRLDPVNLLTTAVPAGKAVTSFLGAKQAAKALFTSNAVSAATKGGVLKSIAGNAVRQAPAAAGLGAVQHVASDPQSSVVDLVKAALTSTATNTALLAGGGALGYMKGRSGYVPEDFRKTPEVVPGAGKTLYSYSPRSWEGNVLKTGPHQGRAWVTEHAPGPWAHSASPGNTALRIWRTGRVLPFEGVSPPIQGPAAAKFSRPPAYGLLRGWKRGGGQHFTMEPGDVNVKTGETSTPTPQQIKRFRADERSMIYDGVGSAFGLALGGSLLYGRTPNKLNPPTPDEIESVKRKQANRRAGGAR